MIKWLSIFVLVGFLAPPLASALTPDELQRAIQDKNNQLVDIRNQILETQNKLEVTSSQSKTLKKEVERLDNTLNQLALGVKLSEINIDKLGLELESLKIKKSDTEEGIGNSKQAISYTLRELQRKENDNLLQIILKNGSLAEGIFEIQSLKDLQQGLVINSAQLEKLNRDLSTNIGEAAKKKRELENENSALKVKRVLANQDKQDKNELLKQTKNQESLYQKQLKELQGQQDLISDQIDAIEEQLKQQLGPGFVPPRIVGFFSWPILMQQLGGVGRITQHYGEKSYLYRGKPHNGLDIGVPPGTLVYAAADGVVVKVDNNDRTAWRKYQYGKYIMIQHGNGLNTLYAHLARQLVREGDKVSRGDVIGYSDTTGYATGPHLHFGAYLTNTVTFKSIAPAAGLVPIGVTLNPEDYL